MIAATMLGSLFSTALQGMQGMQGMQNNMGKLQDSEMSESLLKPLQELLNSSAAHGSKDVCFDCASMSPVNFATT
ncbi:hypothetical protein C4K03_4712 [Pseudomonas synxantha]|uniref:Uncharacterized protein n=1 Tax=Pseudomonas synxantha TaxID=47883 RepID=A0A3G7UBX9_9PSED|nr:hypothetical protein C4K03_4712 [Pseudomonas synxantha]